MYKVVLANVAKCMKSWHFISAADCTLHIDTYILDKNGVTYVLYPYFTKSLLSENKIKEGHKEVK